MAQSKGQDEMKKLLGRLRELTASNPQLKNLSRELTVTFKKVNQPLENHKRIIEKYSQKEIK